MSKLISIHFLFISVESLTDHSPSKLPPFSALPYVFKVVVWGFVFFCCCFFHSSSPSYKTWALPENFPGEPAPSFLKFPQDYWIKIQRQKPGENKMTWYKLDEKEEMLHAFFQHCFFSAGLQVCHLVPTPWKFWGNQILNLKIKMRNVNCHKLYQQLVCWVKISFSFPGRGKSSKCL